MDTMNVLCADQATPLNKIVVVNIEELYCRPSEKVIEHCHDAYDCGYKVWYYARYDWTKRTLGTDSFKKIKKFLEGLGLFGKQEQILINMSFCFNESTYEEIDCFVPEFRLEFFIKNRKELTDGVLFYEGDLGYRIMGSDDTFVLIDSDLVVTSEDPSVYEIDDNGDLIYTVSYGND